MTFSTYPLFTNDKVRSGAAFHRQLGNEEVHTKPTNYQLLKIETASIMKRSFGITWNLIICLRCARADVFCNSKKCDDYLANMQYSNYNAYK